MLHTYPPVYSKSITILLLIVFLLLFGCQQQEDTPSDVKNAEISDPQSNPSNNDLVNTPPTVDAGENQTIQSFTNVELKGIAADDDGNIKTYLWEQISGPTVNLNSTDKETTNFIAPKTNVEIKLTFQLSVSDNNGSSKSDSVDIIVLPNPSSNPNSDPIPNMVPLVDAGPDRTVTEESVVTLQSSSSDSDGTIVAFLWEQISGDSIELNSDINSTLSFYSPSITTEVTLTFQLTVTDDDGAKTTDTVDVTVQPVLVPVGTTRSNPIPFGSTLVTDDWDIELLEFIRGDDAWSLILNENKFNDPAPEGYEYLLVRIRVKSIAQDSDPHSVDEYDFRLTGSQLIKYRPPSVVTPEPELDANLFTGGEISGWATFLVKKGETDVMVIFSPLFSSSDRFLSLDTNTSITVNSSLKDILPTDKGITRNSPAIFGSMVTTENWQIKVVSVLRGESAWENIFARNKFNDPPEPGMEYILVKVYARYIGIDEEGDSIDDYEFESVGSLNILYDNPSIVEPDPGLDFHNYPGGEIEGWVTLSIAESEALPVMIYDPLFDRNNTRYLALYNNP